MFKKKRKICWCSIQFAHVSRVSFFFFSRKSVEEREIECFLRWSSAVVNNKLNARETRDRVRDPKICHCFLCKKYYNKNKKMKNIGNVDGHLVCFA